MKLCLFATLLALAVLVGKIETVIAQPSAL
jgi:hypothetical protein